jgi:hypothetical protein
VDFFDALGGVGAALGAPWAAPALGIASSLFAKKPPQYQAPTQQQQQAYLPPMAQAQYAQAQPYQNFNPNLYDVGNGGLYQGVMNQLAAVNAGGSALPTGYANTVFNNAQSQLGLANDRLKRQNMESANAHGLLNSGSLREQDARTDEGYQMALGNVQSQLTQQDLAQRQNLMQMANSLEGQRYTGSYNLNQMQANAMNMLNSYNQQQQGSQNAWNLQQQQAQNSYNQAGAAGAQQNAALQYGSNLYGYQQGAANQGNMFGNVASLFSKLGAQQIQNQGQSRGGGLTPQYSLRDPIYPTSLSGGFGG